MKVKVLLVLVLSLCATACDKTIREVRSTDPSETTLARAER